MRGAAGKDGYDARKSSSLERGTQEDVERRHQRETEAIRVGWEDGDGERNTAMKDAFDANSW